jgi:hypothetical protein
MSKRVLQSYFTQRRKDFAKWQRDILFRKYFPTWDKSLRLCVRLFKTMHSNLLFLYAQILNPPLFALHTQNATQHY